MSNQLQDDYDYITIEPAIRGVNVYGHGVYDHFSVLEGQPKRCFLDNFPTLEEAQIQFPTADVMEGSTKQNIELPHTAPSWFDEMNAGERWDDDY